MNFFLKTSDACKLRLVVTGPFHNLRRDDYFYEVTLEGHLNRSKAYGIDKRQAIQLTVVYLRSWADRLVAHPVDERDQPVSFNDIIRLADGRHDTT